MANYDPSFFAPLFAAEDRHFWFRGRSRVVEAVLRQLTGGMDPGYRVLEVGCANGNVLAALERGAPRGLVIGMDRYGEGLRYARRRTSCPLIQADITALPFRERFHVVGLFDVLEHLPDDLGVLRDLLGVLVPGGRLLVTVPAHRWLWSYFDEVAHHCRRYDGNELPEKLTAAGYHVEYCTQYMATILPLVWLTRRLQTLRARGGTRPVSDVARGELTIVPGLNGLLTFLLSQEARPIAKRKRMPFGTSLLAIACKVTRA